MMERQIDRKVRKILIVDDDPGIVSLLKDCLEAEGYNVISASNGYMAIEMARRYSPASILLDINMPMMDGLRVFQRLRSSKETSLIPVIFISDVISQLVYPAIHDAPRAAHLKKPIDLADLSSLLRHFVHTYAA